ncbi:hypothetical protein ONZ45_g6342 [Pleurotus djamor]|nr:hypothetical protein ONZ45_g6342 [Pleurotus djamor]
MESTPNLWRLHTAIIVTTNASWDDMDLDKPPNLPKLARSVTSRTVTVTLEGTTRYRAVTSRRTLSHQDRLRFRHTDFSLSYPERRPSKKELTLYQHPPTHIYIYCFDLKICGLELRYSETPSQRAPRRPVVARSLGLGDWINGVQGADINVADGVDQYIITLEGDIAERDRLLQAIRTQLGETQSENVALRQEIDALKKALLSGHGRESCVILNLPPPAPLPAQSAAEKLAAAASAPSTSLLTPNTQKDLPSAPRVGGKRSGFWGGLSPLGGGITPVHAAIVPEWGSILGQGVFGTSGHSSDSSSASSSPGPTTDYGSGEEPAVYINDHKELENINPRLNGAVREAQEDGYGIGGTMPNGFGGVGAGSLDGFADMNPFTMKTLEMYWMQLWGRMAAQYHHLQQAASPNMPKQQQQQQHLSGLAGSLRPAFFAPSSKVNAPHTPYAAGCVGAGPNSSAGHVISSRAAHLDFSKRLRPQCSHDAMSQHPALSTL